MANNSFEPKLLRESAHFKRNLMTRIFEFDSAASLSQILGPEPRKKRQYMQQL